MPRWALDSSFSISLPSDLQWNLSLKMIRQSLEWQNGSRIRKKRPKDFVYFRETFFNIYLHNLSHQTEKKWKTESLNKSPRYKDSIKTKLAIDKTYLFALLTVKYDLQSSNINIWNISITWTTLKTITKSAKLMAILEINDNTRNNNNNADK